MNELEAVAQYMKEHELLLVTAESCTAGLIAARLADVPGAGQLLDCAFVVYSTDAKQQYLNVSRETLETNNLTSEAVAREMAQGALRNGPRANVAVSNTGLADDSDDELPAGTQCFAWAFRSPESPDDIVIFTEMERFEGDRAEIREATALYALQGIQRYTEKWRMQKSAVQSGTTRDAAY